MERRFLREVRVTGRLQHPAIVPIHELGRLPSGRLFYTMKLVGGNTLEHWLSKTTPETRNVPGPDMIVVFTQICDALAYAHKENVVHRDLKPSNVMVGSFGEVQVMDWGLAKELGTASSESQGRDYDETRVDALDNRQVLDRSKITLAGQRLGTLLYMPPEQVRGEINQIRQPSDVFSLGAFLCEILTGLPPYQKLGETGRDFDVWLKRAQMGDVSAGLERLVQCTRVDQSLEKPTDPALSHLVEVACDCLNPDQEKRPPDAEVVAQRLHEYAEIVRRKANEAIASEAKRDELAKRLEAQKEEEAAKEAKLKAEQKARRRQTIATVLGGLVLVILGVSSRWINELAKRRAVAERDRIVAEGKAAMEAQQRVFQEALALFAQATQAVTENDPLQARRLFAESLTRNDVPETRKRLSEVWDVPVVPRWNRAASPANTGEIKGVAFMPDGQRLVAAWGHGSLEWIEPANGSVLKSAKTTVPLTAITLAPNGRSIAVATETPAVEIRDGDAGTLLRSFKPCDDNTVQVAQIDPANLRVLSLAYSPGGRTLAVGLHALGLWFYDPDTGKSRGEPDLTHSSETVRGITTGRFRDELSWFLVGSRNLRLGPLNGRTRDFEQWYTPLEVPDEFLAVDVSPASPLLVFGTQHGRLRVIDLTPKGQQFDLHGHVGDVTAVAFHPDGQTLVSGGADGTVRVWDVLTRTQRAVLTNNHKAVTALAICPDGSSFAAGYQDGALAFYQLSASTRTFQASDNLISGLGWLADDSLFVADWNQNLVVWDANVPRPLRRVGGRMLFHPRQLAIDQARKQLYLANALEPGWSVSEPLSSPDVPADPDQMVILQPGRDESSATLLHHRAQGPLGGPVFSRANVNIDKGGSVIAVRSQDKILASADEENGIRLFNTDNTKVVRPLPRTDNTPVRVLAFSNDRCHLAAGTTSGHILLWDTTSAQAIETKFHLDGAVRDLRFAPVVGEEYLLTAGADQTLRGWERKSDRTWKVSFNASALDVSPDGEWLAAGGSDAVVTIRNVRDGHELCSLTGHRSRITAVAFRSKDRRLATGDASGEVRIWDIDLIAGHRTLDPTALLALANQPGRVETARSSLSASWKESLRRISLFTESRPKTEQEIAEPKAIQSLIGGLPPHHAITKELRERLAIACARHAEAYLDSPDAAQHQRALALANHAVALLGTQVTIGVYLRGRSYAALNNHDKAVQDFQLAEQASSGRELTTEEKKRLAEVNFYNALSLSRLADRRKAGGFIGLLFNAVVNPAAGAVEPDVAATETARHLRQAIEQGFDNWNLVTDDTLLKVVSQDETASEFVRRHAPPDFITLRAGPA